MRHSPEVVKIVNERRLIDSESYERTYWTGAATPRLAVGYYVVSWPDDVPHPRFDENARFSGPYPCYAQAQLVCERGNPH